MAHLERAAYSTNDRVRFESTGVVIWIDEWLAGIVAERHASPEEPGADRKVDASYMEGDGLATEIEIHPSA